MNLSFKLLSGQTFSLEFPADATIGQVKETIAREKDYALDGMKLLFAGAILSDDSKPITEFKVTAGNTLVLMAKKAKWVSKPKQEEEKPSQQAAEQKPSESAPVAPKPTEQPQPQPQQSETQPQQPEAQPPQTASAAPASTLAAGDSYNQAIAEMMAMGFERERVEMCMRMAFNNPDRAAEYLFSGIPPEVEQQFAQRAQSMPQEEQGQSAEEIDSELYGGSESDMQDILAEEEGMGGAGDMDLGALLERIPHFNQLRAAVQANPNLLQPVMQQLAQQSPELLQLISQNPQEFVRLLNQPPQQQPQQQTQQQQQQNPFGNIPPELAAALLGAGIGGGGAGAGPRPGTITVTPEEAGHIDQLMQLGFDRGSAAQAYFACDKDMDAAADFLLMMMEEESAEEEEQHQGGGGDNAEQQ